MATPLRTTCLAVAVAALAGSVASAAGPASGTPAPAAAPAAKPRVLTVEIEGAITLGTREYLDAALARARDEKFDAVAVRLDTPGGEYETTRRMVQDLQESPVPVIVWVGPAGAHAGSAGVFLTLAGHVAAMHPTSNIGAAHPVTGGGRDVEAEGGKEMARKVENDAAALARSTAAWQGRNADWAEKAVRESAAITATDAVKERVVDYLAPDLAAAVEQADRREVKLGAGVVRLRTAGAVLSPQAPTIRQRLLMFIANPSVVAVLTLLGMLGIGIEFYHPGAVLPGAAGAFCMFLVFVASQLIPVNVGAVLLVVAGVGLVIAEAFVTSHGLAGVGGAVCLLLGLLFFVDASAPGQWFEPGALSLSPWLVWPTPVVVAVLVLFMGWKVASGRGAPPQIGSRALLGARGEALADVGPGAGQVFIHGEYWRARSRAPIPKGSRVRVVSVEGLVVTVEGEDQVG
jgi:membrane-bound serine protease (ClpP class)